VPANKAVIWFVLIIWLKETNEMNQSNQTVQINPPRTSQTCLLIYDGQCRLCVTAKKGLERLETHSDATPGTDGSVSERIGQACLGGKLSARSS
jgi:hypothetical protein